MVPRHERSIASRSLSSRLRKGAGQIPGAGFAAPHPDGSGAGRAVAVRSQWRETSTEVGRLSELQQNWRPIPGMGGIDTDLQLDLPQLAFQPDRLRIAASASPPATSPGNQHADRRRRYRQV